MKRKKIIGSILGIFIFTGLFAGDKWPVLQGPYLGQEPPALKPVKFASGIISAPGTYEGGATFSIDGKLFIYKRAWRIIKDGKTTYDEQIWFCQQKDSIWTEPVRVPFDNVSVNWDFNFAPINNRFYFTSRRKGRLNGKIARYSNIWMTEFKGSRWTQPELLDYPINVIDSFSGYPSLTKDGVIYFHTERKGKDNVVNIYFSRPEKGIYKKAVDIGASVNSAHRDYDPCIAPDESYIIFLSNRAEPTKNAELYISFRQPDGNWSKPASMAPELKNVQLPVVSTDGKYIFFTRPTSPSDPSTDIYWVAAGIIEKFRPKAKNNGLYCAYCLVRTLNWNLP